MDAVIKTGNGKFNFRVAGVLIVDNQVLLHKAETDSFWALPGGRVQISERSEDALIREIQEETGMRVKTEGLLWTVENFFHYEGEAFHEIGFYYRMCPELPLEKQKSFYGLETDRQLVFRWFPLDQLDDIEVRPSFLKERLKGLPEHATHIVVDTR
ncbi:NUDIX hydrolase [Alteribacter natronophilus]|uniref:NUDIX hydrolase n=1 Tax=Alteribacter natronophilus TaxID=2583810 RepID=UPI00110D3175|nr:NUDIX hydrolase [Alteribacter natronophilus]TMW70089.1 NUDIX hydrolase [Alteribacter natronophilus]